jgi:hypothetical protein
VVAIGGGHGLAAALEAVQSYASEITAVVSVADDGGSSGRLTIGDGGARPRRHPPLPARPHPRPGHLVRAVQLPLPRRADDTADPPQDVAGHALGNLLLVALADLCGGRLRLAVKQAGSLLGALGTVVPASTGRCGCRPTSAAAESTGRWRSPAPRAGSNG